MKGWRALICRCWPWRQQREEDLDRELQAHLELEAEEMRDAGMTPEEARFAARRAFGNTTYFKEETRAMWGWSSWERVVQDFRFAVRLFGRSPGFTIVAVLTLGLGIGVNTAVFSVVDAVLLRPLPFPEPERLMRLWEAPPGSTSGRNPVNPLNYLDWKERSRRVAQMAALYALPMNVAGDGEPVALSGMLATWETFSVLGIAPVTGRGFLPEDGTPGQEQRALLSYELWQSRFGGSRDIVGGKITVNGSPCTVVGVLPPVSSLPNLKADLWVAWPLVRGEGLGGRFHGVIGRLQPGVDVTQAQEELSIIARQLSEERPVMNKGWGAEVVPFLDDATEQVRLPLLVLLAAVGFVLLIACANVANLLLMRSTGRLREISVRAALGGGRLRIAQQLLSESLLLGMAGCVVGVVLGYLALQGVLAIVPAAANLPRIESIQLDARVFVFALGASWLTAVLSGLVPVLRVSGSRLTDALRQHTQTAAAGGYGMLRRVFVVSQIALAVLLLVGAGLMLRSFTTLLAVDPGFSTERLLTLQLFTSPSKYGDDRVRAEYIERILEEIRQMPDVEAAGSVHFLPLTGQTSGSCFSRADRPAPEPGESPGAHFLVVTKGYFRAMRMPVLSGRDFGERDRHGSAAVIVVNRALAERFFPGEDPIGKRLNLCWHVESAEIVGIVANARQTELKAAPEPTIFVSNAQAPMYFARLVVRTKGEPEDISRAVVSAVRRVDPEQAVSNVQSMEQVLSDSVARPRVQLVLMLVFAGVATLLAVIGLYGVASYSVSQRTQEIGIRMAIGAGRGEVAGMVMRESLWLAAAGLTLGLAGAVALTRVMRSLLYEVTPTDPMTLAGVSLLVAAVVMIGSFLPARRAASVNPVIALRYE
jgi:predicted permease